MLFDESSRLMFDFQSSIFDSAIFIFLFRMLNLRWLKIHKFVKLMEQT